MPALAAIDPPAAPVRTSLADTLGVPFVYDLRAQRTVYLHDGCALMRGYTPDEVRCLQADLFGLVPDEERGRVQEALATWQTQHSGHTDAFAFRVELPRLGRRWLSGRISIPEQPDGAARLAVGYLHLTN